MKKYILIVVGSLIFMCNSHAQYTVEGRVTDINTNEGLPGAYVTICNTSIVSVTNSESEFTLHSDKKIDSIIVSFIGYRTKKIAVTSEYLNIYMEQSSNELDQIIVSAQRESQSRKDVPISISLLPAKIIDETKATEIADLLNKVSGVYVANFGNENQSVSIRQPLSFIRTQLVILEDEIPIVPTTIATSGNLKEINMAAVKSIEVLKGPASSIYGSEAIGGTVNFITKNPTQMPSARVSIQANDMGYKRLDFEAGGKMDNLGILAAGYTAQCSDSYRDYCDFKKSALLLKATYNFNEETMLTTTLSYIHHNTNVSGSLDSTIFFTNDKYNQYKFCYSNDLSMRANIRIDKTWNDENKTFAVLHYRGNNENQIPTYYIQRVYGGPPPPRYKGEFIESGYHSYGLLIQHRLKFNLMDAQLIAGLSSDYTPYKYVSKEIDVTKEGDLYTTYSLTDTYVQDFKAGLFNSAEYLLFEFTPLYKLKISSALRYDRLDYNYINNLPSTAISGAPDDRNTFDQLSPKIGLNYNMTDNLGIYANYSTGFAPPLFSQLYKGVTVPTLKPASFSNYEMGGWLGFGNNKGYADLSLYSSKGVNEIVSVLLEDGTSQNQSTGKTIHRGIEYSVKYNFFDQVDIRISAANSVHKFVYFVSGANDYSGKKMNLAPRFIANADITYRPVYLKNFRITAELENIGRYYIDEMNTNEYKGYRLLNLRTGYNFRRFDFWLNILNVTNDLYAVRVQKSSYGTGAITYMPGTRRSFFLGLEYSITGKNKRSYQE